MPEMRSSIAMLTAPGMSVHREIAARIETAREESRTAALEEAIAFLGTHGFTEAAEALQRAAFGQREGAGHAPA